MTGDKRPLSVIVIAVIYIAVGAAGFVNHFPHTFEADDFWIEPVEILAVVSGVFMLLRRNWARWLAIAWMASHVVLSAFDRFHGFAVHALLFAAITWLLLRPDAAQYFRNKTR